MAFGTAAEAPKKRNGFISDRALNELFKPATELRPDGRLKVAVWGRAKVGKSHFCLTPETDHIYVIDTESAMAINVQQFGDKKEKIHVAEILQFADKHNRQLDLVKSLDALIDAVDKVTDLLMSDDLDEESFTFVIDSASDLWNWLGIWLDELPGTAHIKGGENISRLEWGKANKKYDQCMHLLKHANCNVICTFRAKDGVDKDGSNTGIDLAQWQKRTDYWFDTIMHLMIRPPNRVGEIVSRYAGNIPVLINPTFPSLVGHMEKASKVKFR